jgi:hypothetical protein
MRTTSFAWFLQVVPQHLWIVNAIEVFDTWARAKDAMDRREAERIEEIVPYVG